ncbi:MAG: DUF4340 domain-containing protein [Akkermansiaceae bacterium]|jgi:hypothetical protein|nr:DUF4340 domain-containing protein [Akkermansiaceae bacterium]
MKARTVAILWIIALLLGSAVFFIKKSQGGDEKNATTRTAGQTLIQDFPAEETSVIEINGVENTVTLTKKDGSWIVTERDGFPANTSTINDLLRSLTELKVTQGIEAGSSFAARFGMDENSSDPLQRGLTATFKNSGGDELAKISFGKSLDSASSASPFGGGSTGRYVRNHADESGFYAVSEMFSALSADPKDWLLEDFLTIEKIQTIDLTQPNSDTSEWTLTRDDENSDFKFTDAFPGVNIDTAATAPLKSLFSYTRFEDLIPASEVEKLATPEKLQKATITTFEGFKYEIALQPVKTEEGKVPSENFLMTVAVSAELPKERNIPADEKPEDAAAADKAFTERLATLTKRLETAKALEGRTFELTKFTVDALLKNRTDLMSKGDGPAPSAPTLPPGTSAVTEPIQIPYAPPTEEE